MSKRRISLHERTASKNGQRRVFIPAPYTGSTTVQVFSFQDVPTSEDLNKLLNAEGIDTSTWGQGNTKAVSLFWKEMKLDEAGFEIWKKPTGERFPVRVTHVLRAKVSSPENYKKNVFLFNTWQQYGDGRTRTRNGLLSEKLQMSEMPLEAHLHEVCQRAVTEEEMQRVCDAQTKIGPGQLAPEYDQNYKCPLTVVDEVFVEHTIEIEASKSYPGLLTVYNLYTVDIICTGLPTLNFNTMEFEHEDAVGKRPLKYIHAWVWLKWEAIQRYLLEGSEMKEHVSKGKFESPQALQDWLAQFDLDITAWSGGRSVKTLFDEIEREETELEHWGRQDGVPILMRVVHVVQVKITTQDKLLEDKFLVQESRTSSDGRIEAINRLLARKINIGKNYTPQFFEERAQEAMKVMAYMVDVHFTLDPNKPPKLDNLEKFAYSVSEVCFHQYRYSMDKSHSYKGILTMYHLYTVQALCNELPAQDFGSLSAPDVNGKFEASLWRWATWEDINEMLNIRYNTMQERDADAKNQISSSCSASERLVGEMEAALNSMSSEDPAVSKLRFLVGQIRGEVLLPLQTLASAPPANTTSAADRLPPSIISSLADRKLISDEILMQVPKNRESVLMKRVSSRYLDDAGEKSLAAAGGSEWTPFAWCSGTHFKHVCVDET
eukprot:TRINITY_DN33528_c0_g1_i1.p1 TRINITY_DN33528_c0_g1~~TRINITY_DN33528_c0_g1_i1.p1  ORF type:complete len:661 (+),score=123.93 TRINITY_DN33528_c0_g1_i1:46-2028(+)